MVVMEAGSNVFTCCDSLGPFFGILDKKCLDGHHWLLSPWQNHGAISSRLDAKKHLDDLLHSAGKASPLLSGWGLSYNHSQCTHGRLHELHKPKIEMGTALVINNLWSILNNTTANIDIPVTCGPIFLAGWLIFMILDLFLPLALSFMTSSQRRWVWWWNTRKT